MSCLTADEDYTPQTTTLTFDSLNDRRLVEFLITDDQVDENLERFLANLTLTSSNVERVEIRPDQATLLIEDNDGQQQEAPHTFVLALLHCLCCAGVVINIQSPSYTVIEGNRSIEVCAEIVEGTLERMVVVILTTSNGTASGEN